MAQSEHRNRLSREASPYLLQHAANPVDWHPWGEEALARARQEDRPIFLSIGYLACHWCHVMERESFEDSGVAALLNASFVPIKVDREERPDIDAVYMPAVQAMTGSGGWPLSVFLTPGLKPFFGGTYFPPERRWGRPAFREVLLAIAQSWQTRRVEIEHGADALSTQLLQLQERGTPIPLDAGAVGAAAMERLAESFDPQWGGFGSAPKFPTPSRLFLLLRQTVAGDDTAKQLLEGTLNGMAAGGMYDWVGGGFHRYSVDERWLIPHFEKMLYDNALLARLYGAAGVALGNDRWIEVARETTDYLLREMQGPEGGFYSSTDADSERQEGLYFTWTAEEVRDALAADETDLVMRLCGLTDPPNFEGGRSVLRPSLGIPELAAQLSRGEEELSRIVAAARDALREARAKRTPPACDDKRLAGWNGMALWSLAHLAPLLDEPRYLDAARRCAQFLLAELIRPGEPVVRSWRDGRRSGAETLEDVAWLTAGLLELFQADGDPVWLRAALWLVEARLPHYGDEAGRLLEASDDGESLLMRPRNPTDGAIPAACGVMASALLRLAALTGQDELRSTAARVVKAESGILASLPDSATTLVEVAGELDSGIASVVVVGEPAWESTRLLLHAAHRHRPPACLVVPSPSATVPEELVALVPLFQGRSQVNGECALAFYCRGASCLLPTTDPQELARVLSSSSP